MQLSGKSEDKVTGGKGVCYKEIGAERDVTAGLNQMVLWSGQNEYPILAMLKGKHFKGSSTINRMARVK